MPKSTNKDMPKKTAKLTKKQVFAIPVFLNKDWTIKKVADRYKVSEQAVYYHVRRLRESGVKIKTRKRGQVSVIYN